MVASAKSVEIDPKRTNSRRLGVLGRSLGTYVAIAVAADVTAACRFLAFL